MSDTKDDPLGAAAAGDRDALTALLRQHGPQVRQRLHIASVWRTAFDADDVMQVTYLEAFLRIDQLASRTTEAFVAWLNQIAQNSLRQAIRDLERQKRPDPRRQLRRKSSDDSAFTLLHTLADLSGRTPSRAVVRDEWRQALESALRQLPPDYAVVVRRVDLEGGCVGDVAQALGRSPGAVCMLRARALQRLQELLGSQSRFFSA